MPSKSELEKEIARSLPRLSNKTEEALLAQLGERRMIMLGQETEGVSTEAFFDSGRKYFIKYTAQLREVVCDAYSRKQIDEVITPANVLALATLLITIAGLSAAFPPVLVTIAVLILRVGLHNFCKGYVPAEA